MPKKGTGKIIITMCTRVKAATASHLIANDDDSIKRVILLVIALH